MAVKNRGGMNLRFRMGFQWGRNLRKLKEHRLEDAEEGGPSLIPASVLEVL